MSIRSNVSFAIFGCLLAAYPEAAIAIDCSKADTDRERTVCQSDRLLAFDIVLNATYRSQLSLENNPHEGDEGRNLRREQLQWIGIVDECGTETTCIGEAYARRYVALRSYSDFRFVGMENLLGLTAVLEPWVTADPATVASPIAMRISEAAYLVAVPVSWGKPFAYYEVYFMEAGENPEKVVFPDLYVAWEMATKANSGNFGANDIKITSGDQYQGMSFVKMDVVSKSMTGGAGSEWIYRRWRIEPNVSDGVKPTLVSYRIESVGDGYTVDVIGTADE